MPIRLLLLLCSVCSLAAAEPGSEYDGVALPAVAATAAAAAAGPAVLRCDPARVAAPGDAVLTGLNHTWVGADRLYASPALPAVLAGVRLPLNRMAGSDSQTVRWRDLIGPVEARPALTDYYGKPMQNRIGIVEWIRACREVDAQARFAWVLNCVQEEPEDHAALAEFLTGDAARGGWAARRAELGLAEPVPVDIWEIGNEVDFCKPGRARFPDAAAYAAYAARCIEAIRAVQPAARFAACGATAPWAWKERGWGDWRVWNRDVLAALAGRIDGLAFHPYYDGLPQARIEAEFLDPLRDDLAALGGGRVRLLISEHGRWPSDLKRRETWAETHALDGCLAVGAFVARMAQRAEVADLMLHAFSAGPWGLVYAGGRQGSPQGVWSTGLVPLYRALQAWEEGGGAVFQADLADPAASAATRPLVAAVRGDAAALRLLLVNRSGDRERRLDWQAPGAWRLAGGVRLTGPAAAAVNGPDAAPIACTGLAAEAGPFTGIVLPPLSLSVLRLEAQQ